MLQKLCGNLGIVVSDHGLNNHSINNYRPGLPGFTKISNCKAQKEREAPSETGVTSRLPPSSGRTQALSNFNPGGIQSQEAWYVCAVFWRCAQKQR